MLLWAPLAAPSFSNPSTQVMCNTIFEKLDQPISSQDLSPKIGNLNPILVEHTGYPSGSGQFQIGRTDSESNPSSKVLLPASAEGNSRSADCSGGYFLVGTGGSVDFGSPEGTISLWIKWDASAPHGRFWGQDGNFETRWESDRLTLSLEQRIIGCLTTGTSFQSCGINLRTF